MKKSGEMNPMYGKKHSEDTKQKISNSQKQRYAVLKKALNEKDNFKINKCELQNCLDKSNLNIDDVHKTINFLSLVLKDSRIKNILAEELVKIINNK